MSAAIVAVGYWVLGAIGYRSIVTASEVIELACRLGKAEKKNIVLDRKISLK